MTMTRRNREAWWAAVFDSEAVCVGLAVAVLALLLLAGVVGYYLGSGP